MSTNRRKSSGTPRSKPHPNEAGTYNRTLIEASLDPLVTFDAHGKITDVNAATEKVTGLSRSNLIGTDFSDYFTDPARARTGYKKPFREGPVQDYALEIRHKNGHETPVLYNATVYKNAAGVVEGVFAAARDITSLKKAEGELASHLGRLEEEVRTRTTELALTNQHLEKEIADRTIAEEALAGERAKAGRFAWNPPLAWKPLSSSTSPSRSLPENCCSPPRRRVEELLALHSPRLYCELEEVA